MWRFSSESARSMRRSASPLLATAGTDLPVIKRLRTISARSTVRDSATSWAMRASAMPRSTGGSARIASTRSRDTGTPGAEAIARSPAGGRSTAITEAICCSAVGISASKRGSRPSAVPVARRGQAASVQMPMYSSPSTSVAKSMASSGPGKVADNRLAG